jgi:hypothetical protein
MQHEAKEKIYDKLTVFFEIKLTSLSLSKTTRRKIQNMSA